MNQITLTSPIEYLNFELHILRRFKNHNYNTIADLSKITKKELLEFIDEDSFNELLTIFHSNKIMFDFEKEYYNSLKKELKNGEKKGFKKLVLNNDTRWLLQNRFVSFNNIFNLTENAFKSITRIFIKQENIEEFIYLTKYIGLNFLDSNDCEKLLKLSLDNFEPLISVTTYEKLKKSNIITLENLLSETIDSLSKIDNLTKPAIIEIILLVEHLGYQLKEDINPKSIIYKYKIERQNFSLTTSIENFKPILSSKAYQRLRRSNIHNINDLISKSSREIAVLKGVGYLCFQEITNFIDFLGYSFNHEPKTKVKSESFIKSYEEGTLKKLLNTEIHTNNEIKDRINTKQELLNQYDSLIKEKQKLLQIEQEIDDKIEQVLNSLVSIKKKTKK